MKRQTSNIYENEISIYELGWNLYACRDIIIKYSVEIQVFSISGMFERFR